MSYFQVRENIIKFLGKELLGPEAPNEIIKESPEKKYILGIISSKNIDSFETLETTDNKIEVENIIEDDENSDLETANELEFKNKNSRLQSFGLNFYVSKNCEELNLICSWGSYTKIENSFKRNPIIYNILSFDISQFSGSMIIENGIVISYLKREIKGTDLCTVSLFLTNDKVGDISEASLFQAEIKIIGDLKNEYLTKSKITEKDFLFREKEVYGRGHSCAVEWKKLSENKVELKTNFMPQFELPSITPEIDSISLSMKLLGDKEEYIYCQIEKLINEYEKWIDRLEIKNLENKENEFIKPLKQKCLTVLNRMKGGVHLLKTNPKAMYAFKFMNVVMFTQYCLKKYSKERIKTPEIEFENLCDNEDGLNWRPFQLGFILINLKGIVEPEDEERKIIDLLWFPTGGGKTEAYLGLMMFSIAYRRLNSHINDEFERDGGVSVILRYTLRLLTTQQKDRLLKTICAAEFLRSNGYFENLGHEIFSVGFWVGSSVTANNFDKKYLKEIKQGLYSQILECPFCGEKIKGNKNIEIKLFEKSKKGSTRITCSNERCFHSDNPIPIYFIDSEIYEKKPTVIIGTVDKFAQLPWNNMCKNIFGKISSNDLNQKKPYLPPELIIQDELHLINGALGTVYGAYELAIEELCSYVDKKGRKIKPKYVVSTATIEKAEEQILKLYGREKERVSQFPPSGIRVSDSFFSKEMIATEEKPFRMYLGLSAFGYSNKTTLVRVYSALLAAIKTMDTDDELKNFIDPYYTLLGYFNSINELGGAVSLVEDDIKQHLRVTSNNNKIENRYINNKPLELTSRIDSLDIPKNLNLLEKECNEKGVIDVALATNMISVGLDIDRLGLMVMNCQPKQTSEYIQATSRVGRKHPGLVVTIYNSFRPRDVSFYENFIPYHSSFYKYVEGVSITPFSARARERDLHAIIISLLRLNYNSLDENNDAKGIRISDNQKLIDEVKLIIKERVGIVQNELVNDTLKDFEEIIIKWKNLAKKDGNLNYSGKEGESLLINFDKTEEIGFKTLRSMRNVSKSINLYLYRGSEDGVE
ncbi:helicase-related protein [Cetobacterium sp.]|uniref:helicase-related protein n=1 Tax=Cetobacterium sp. TaxID=2071632 RepID=UPI003F37549F